MDRKKLKEEVARILADDESLVTNGTGYNFAKKGTAKYVMDRAEFFTDRELRMVEVCLKWLESFPKEKKIFKNYGSYALKHVVEKAAGEYVHNGAFIVAARIAGFRDDGEVPNPHFNIKVTDAHRKALWKEAI